MATVQLDATQAGFVDEVTSTTGGAISGMVRVTYDDSVSKADIIRQIDAIKARIIESNYP